MDKKTWTVTFFNNFEEEEVNAVSCEIGNKAMVFRSAAGIGVKEGAIVRAYAHGNWKDVKLKESK